MRLPAIAAAQPVLARTLPRLDFLLTFAAIYLVHSTYVLLLVKPFSPQVQLFQPFGFLPIYLFAGWDSGWYSDLYRSYDRFTWPPLYPFTLRAVTFLFQFGNGAFYKSALIVNMASHLAIAYAVPVYLRRLGLPGAPAWVVTFALLFYPGHNTFFAAYSESMFLAITLFIFILRQREGVLASSTLAGLSTLVRSMGCFLCAALVLEQLVIAWRLRRLDLRRLVAASAGLAIFGVWNLFVVLTANTDLVKANSEWIDELVRNHVTPGMHPRLWSFLYIGFSLNKEPLFFWASLGVVAFCLWRRLYLEAFYVLLFDLSLVLYTYRPFSWSRWSSVLFPWAVALGYALRGRPRLQVAVLATCIAVAFYFQTMLFSNRIGEP